MALEQEQIVITVKAEGDLSGHQYRAIKVTNAGYGTVAQATTDVVIGILMNKPAAYDRAAKVCIGGLTKAIAGAAISTIGLVSVLNNGLLCTSTDTPGNWTAKNITTAAGSAEYVEIIL